MPGLRRSPHEVHEGRLTPSADPSPVPPLPPQREGEAGDATPPGRRNRSSGAERRLARELATVLAMLRIHCRGVHGSGPPAGGEADADVPAGGRGLCGECAHLWDYVRERAGRCPFLEDKPTCLDCPVHCYRGEMGEAVRRVMRYAGPRMWWRHPVLTLFHFLDGRRKGAPRR